MAESSSTPGRAPLFSLRVLILATLILTLGVAVGIRWMMGLSDGASLLAASAASLLICFGIGEFIRGRFQLSLRVLLALVTVVALFCGMFGNRLVESRKQHRAVTTIVQAGGYVTYKDSDLDDLGGGWFRTRGGWIVPVRLRDVLGNEFYAEVEDVSLQGAVLSEESLEQMDFDQFPRLSFNGTKLNPAVMARIGTLTHLRSLDVSDTGIDDADLEHLAGLKNLESIAVGNNPQLTEQGLEPISRLPELKALLLHRTNVRGTWFQHLADFPSLNQLVLSSTSITDADLTQVAELSNLEGLRLDDTSITDAGLEHLRGLPKLRVLGLTRTRVTEEGITEFQEALPNCEIIR